MRFDGGRVWLDLVAAEEGLPQEDRLADWLYGSGLVPEGTPVPVAQEWPGRFEDLRTLLRRLAEAEVDGAEPALEDIAALNGFARPAPPAPAAVRQDTGAVLHKQLAAPPTCEALLSAVARDAVDLLTDPLARARLRRCEGERCTRIYLDTSRGRRRRWCSSEVCGNRERVARHRRRSTLTASQG
jgi:predicted RNA-binding Zn ribbon-like protein